MSDCGLAPCALHGVTASAGPDLRVRIAWLLAGADEADVRAVYEEAMRRCPEGVRPEWRAGEGAPCP
ncbi:MAG: hypothetical protein WKG00_03180 [Polyangiaceae bacterium]